MILVLCIEADRAVCEDELVVVDLDVKPSKPTHITLLFYFSLPLTLIFLLVVAHSQ